MLHSACVKGGCQHAVTEQESSKEEDVRCLLDELETATDVHDACERLQRLIEGLRPNNNTLQQAGVYVCPTRHTLVSSFDDA